MKRAVCIRKVLVIENSPQTVIISKPDRVDFCNRPVRPELFYKFTVLIGKRPALIIFRENRSIFRGDQIAVQNAQVRYIFFCKSANFFPFFLYF